VRLHLERLVEAGLVVRERERQARGRPRDTWSISPDVGMQVQSPSELVRGGRAAHLTQEREQLCARRLREHVAGWSSYIHRRHFCT
jgi:predicted transcriptional regulator